MTYSIHHAAIVVDLHSIHEAAVGVDLYIIHQAAVADLYSIRRAPIFLYNIYVIFNTTF